MEPPVDFNQFKVVSKLYHHKRMPLGESQTTNTWLHNVNPFDCSPPIFLHTMKSSWNASCTSHVDTKRAVIALQIKECICTDADQHGLESMIPRKRPRSCACPHVSVLVLSSCAASTMPRRYKTKRPHDVPVLYCTVVAKHAN